VGGLGVDTSNWMMQRRHLQTEADAAALAGAWELSNGGTTTAADAAALREATNNGYSAASATLTPSVSGAIGSRVYKVDMTEVANLWLSRIYIKNSFNIAATASAGEVPGGSYCALALDPTASGAISTAGSANINSTSCGIAANSSSSTSVTVGGSSTLHVGAVTLAGSYQANSGFTYSSIRTHAATIVDPYASLGLPPSTSAATCTGSSCTSAAACSNNQRNSHNNINSNTTWSMPAGASAVRLCGEYHITSAGTVLTLNPGVYVIDSSTATALSITSSGSIVGTGGVTIIITNSADTTSTGSINLSGTGQVKITAPTSGTYAGIAIYQDRHVTSGSNTITGGAGFDVEGAVYTPSGSLTFGGTSSASTCTQLLAKTVSFQGNPSMNNTCATQGTKSIGAAVATAKLVL
jgi:hypothetical protein